MYDNNKICFIYCSNNDQLVQESINYLNILNVPAGFSWEYRIIKDAPFITQAYNNALNSSNAKYKVYLHQDMMILNKNFMNDILDLFIKYPSLGMLGVAGAKVLPPTGVWVDSTSCYGKFYWGESSSMQLFAWHEVVGEFEPVQVVDGIIMITQYDLPWRADLFQNWHFYDISQCMEYLKAGLTIGIPHQPEPWCLHKIHNMSALGYETERQIFVREYGHYLTQ